MWYNFPMIHPNFKLLRAIGVMIGSVVGVGVFGLPYALAQGGVAAGALVLVLMAGVVLAMQLMYAEVALHTPGQHRLAGYVRIYLGERWSRFALVALAAALCGAMVAYLIVGGGFLHGLLSPLFGGSPTVYACALAFVAALFMRRGIQFVSRVEAVAVFLLLFLFAFMTLAALPHVRAANLDGFHAGSLLMTYGVALFALSGMGVIPEMKAILGLKQERHLPRAVVISVAVIVLLYLAFSMTVAGALGPRVTESAFDGLVPLLGGSFGAIAALLGSVTVTSIFTVVGIELVNTLRHDFKVKPNLAVIGVVGVPLVLYLAGVRQLMDVLAFVGAVFGGSLGVVVVLMYEKMRSGPVCVEHRCLNVPRLASWLVIAVFVSGTLLTLAHLF